MADFLSDWTSGWKSGNSVRFGAGVEQPMAFLEEQSMWPLSLYLPQLGMEQAGYAFAVSVIVLIPALFVYALGQDALVDGIAVMTMKR